MCDLDGVLWLADHPISGSAEAVNRLRKGGVRVVFFTNNSFVTKIDQIAKFKRNGIDVRDADLLGSAQAAAQLVEPGERVFVLGGEGIEEAIAERGVESVCGADPTSIDAVLVGLDLQLNFSRLTEAVRAVAAGARLIGTNDDATYPTPDGPLPGGGSILAAVAFASGATPIVAGKPYPTAASLVHRTVGAVDLMVGDRPETDGAFAVVLGAPFALVRSGVTGPGATPKDPPAKFDAADLATIVDELL
jgi:HAD superfamily hydrolase (TIGR01450 family)